MSAVGKKLSCGNRRTIRYALVLLALAGCRPLPSGPARAIGSAKPVAAASVSPSGTPSVLSLVASGRELTMTVVGHAHAEGLRIQISGRASTAHADGDGALVADVVAEPSFSAPFDPAQEILTYAGTVPKLFAFRQKDVPCAAIDDATVLVLQGKKWREHPLRGRGSRPHAFLAWNGGALIVDSPVQACGWATSSPIEYFDQRRGTVFTWVGPTGTLSHPTLGLDSTFMAWGASSSGDSLALVGTYGVRADAGIPEFGTRDIVVMRRHGQGPFRASVIVKAEGRVSQSSRTGVREFGSAALLWPPPVHDDGTPVTAAPTEGGDEIAWKGHASSIFRITDEGTSEFVFRSASEQECSVRDSALVGEEVYAIVECPNTLPRLVRAVAHGEPERVGLPSLPKFSACSPAQITVRAPDDLWVRAECTTANKPRVDAVFRTGHAQEPLLVP